MKTEHCIVICVVFIIVVLLCCGLHKNSENMTNSGGVKKSLNETISYRDFSLRHPNITRSQYSKLRALYQQGDLNDNIIKRIIG